MIRYIRYRLLLMSTSNSRTGSEGDLSGAFQEMVTDSSIVMDVTFRLILETKGLIYCTRLTKFILVPFELKINKSAEFI